MDSAGYKNRTGQHRQGDNTSPRGFRHENENAAYFWINSALVASNWSQITFCILTNVLTSISERFCPSFEQINVSPRATAITLPNSPKRGI